MFGMKNALYKFQLLLLINILKCSLQVFVLKFEKIQIVEGF